MSKRNVQNASVCARIIDVQSAPSPTDDADDLGCVLYTADKLSSILIGECIAVEIADGGFERS